MKTLGLEDPFIDHWPLELGSSEEVLQMIRERGGDCGRYRFLGGSADSYKSIVCGYFSRFFWRYNCRACEVYGPLPLESMILPMLPDTNDWLIDLASRERLTSRRLSEKAGITINPANRAIRKAIADGRIEAVSQEETGNRFGREECGKRLITVYGLAEV